MKTTLTAIAAYQDGNVRTTQDGTMGEIHTDTDHGPHQIRAKAWAEDTVQLTFTVDGKTAGRIAQAYNAIAASI